MLQLLWNIFRETGQINTYMFYKALENSNLDYDSRNASESSKVDIAEPCPEGCGRIGNEFTC